MIGWRKPRPLWHRRVLLVGSLLLCLLVLAECREYQQMATLDIYSPEMRVQVLAKRQLQMAVCGSMGVEGLLEVWRWGKPVRLFHCIVVSIGSLVWLFLLPIGRAAGELFWWGLFTVMYVLLTLDYWRQYRRVRRPAVPRTNRGEAE